MVYFLNPYSFHSYKMGVIDKTSFTEILEESNEMVDVTPRFLYALKHKIFNIFLHIASIWQEDTYNL